MITPSNSQGNQRPWRNLARKAQKQASPAPKNTITTLPQGPAQIDATRSGTPGTKRCCSSGIQALLAAIAAVKSSRVKPTTTAIRAATSSRNWPELAPLSNGRK